MLKPSPFPPSSSGRWSLVASILLSLPLQAATLTGYWSFDNSCNIGQATVGNNLGIAGTAPAYSANLPDDFSTSLSGVNTTTAGTANRLVTASEVSALGAVGTAIPEPEAALLGGLGILGLFRRRA